MKRIVIGTLIAALVAPMAHSRHLPPYPDGTNGCSGGVSSFWRNVTHRVPVWENCCYAHDLAYRRGGVWSDRARAYRTLFACVTRADPFAGTVMFVAVVALGQIHFPFNLSRIASDAAALNVYARAGAE